ncbi:MAG: hypothetical protein LLF89_02780, partial [Spirochaetaceae bacterium]|nr:hypothetical protein [Spirochaetaceae bacterium]
MKKDSLAETVCSLDAGELSPEPAIFVVFGATGDLARRKIFPALFDLFEGKILPEATRIIGFARRPLGTEQF